MKSLLVSLLAFSSVIGASTTRAQTPATAAAGEKPQRMVLIATLNTPEANREFQRNVQVMQAERQALVDLNTQMEREKDAKKKAEIKMKIDAGLKKINEDNQTMQKAYGFSLTRNYTVEIVSSNIYMLVTDEEAAQIDKASKQQPDSAGKAKPVKK